MRPGSHLLVTLLRSLILTAFVAGTARATELAFALRGYYLTMMRMPVMGLPEWREAIDCFAEDGANTVILWTAGGFRSRKFPVTWEYNAEHANIREDFVPALIEYAHTKGIRVLLGFTPFGYDGVNRFPLEHRELKARNADGSPVDEFGIHSRGWNLCPAKPESQRLMREYIGEMVFEFYPGADGLLVESSDYAICHCPDCGPRYYEHELAFVRWLSEELWRRKPDASILVCPHYFTGAKVPGLDAIAARQPFDSRWGLYFTPHSAHFDRTLIAKAKASIAWSDSPVLGTPQGVAAAARTARDHGVSGFIPSMEAFSYVALGPDGREPTIIGKRLQPFGLDPMGDGRMPYRSLPARVQRFAFREFSREPGLDMAEWERRLGSHIFGNQATPQLTADLLELQRIWSHERDWYWASPLLDPELFQARATRLKWPQDKLAAYEANLTRLKQIASGHAESGHAAIRELAGLAQMVVDRWGQRTPLKARPN
jgi:hypothetical protein